MLTETEKLEKILLDGEGNEKLSGCQQSTDYLASGPPLYGLDHISNSDGVIRQRHKCCADTDSTAKNTTETLNNSDSSRKRKRTGFINQVNTRIDSSLPSHEILNATIDAYFSSTHHWIPFLHPFRFKKDMENPGKRSKLEIVLHAIVYSSIHRLGSDKTNITRAEIMHQTDVSRNTVVLKSMDSLTVENLQALVIVAFTSVSSSRHWKIDSDEFMRLSTDKLIKPGPLLGR